DVFLTKVWELSAWTAGGKGAKEAEAWSVEGAATEAAGEAWTWLPWATVGKDAAAETGTH
ncbi:hypothetical protein U1Q18_037642, partial [Sarracenia purpurea var. burkii]